MVLIILWVFENGIVECVWSRYLVDLISGLGGLMKIGRFFF